MARKETAVGAASGREHPLASAIVAAASGRGLDLSDADDFDAPTGNGVRGTVDGAEVALGHVHVDRDRREPADHVMKRKSAMFANDTKRAAAVIAAAGTAMATLGSARAQGTQGYDHMMWNGGWGHWIFGPAMMLLFLGVLVFGVAAAIRWMGSGDRPDRSGKSLSARAILKERFARGEIDEREFQERKRTLEN